MTFEEFLQKLGINNIPYALIYSKKDDKLLVGFRHNNVPSCYRISYKTYKYHDIWGGGGGVRGSGYYAVAWKTNTYFVQTGESGIGSVIRKHGVQKFKIKYPLVYVGSYVEYKPSSKSKLVHVYVKGSLYKNKKFFYVKTIFEKAVYLTGVYPVMSSKGIFVCKHNGRLDGVAQKLAVIYELFRDAVDKTYIIDLQTQVGTVFTVTISAGVVDMALKLGKFDKLLKLAKFAQRLEEKGKSDLKLGRCYLTDALNNKEQFCELLYDLEDPKVLEELFKYVMKLD